MLRVRSASATRSRRRRRPAPRSCRRAGGEGMSELGRGGTTADELFLMTNLFPATTGLPMVVWVGPSYGAPHDVRVKVMQAHGTRMRSEERREGKECTSRAKRYREQ